MSPALSLSDRQCPLEGAPARAQLSGREIDRKYVKAAALCALWRGVDEGNVRGTSVEYDGRAGRIDRQHGPGIAKVSPQKPVYHRYLGSPVEARRLAVLRADLEPKPGQQDRRQQCQKGEGDKKLEQREPGRLAAGADHGGGPRRTVDKEIERARLPSCQVTRTDIA